MQCLTLPTPNYDKLLAFVLALILSIVLKTGPNSSVQLGYLGTNLRTIFFFNCTKLDFWIELKIRMTYSLWELVTVRSWFARTSHSSIMVQTNLFVQKNEEFFIARFWAIILACMLTTKVNVLLDALILAYEYTNVDLLLNWNICWWKKLPVVSGCWWKVDLFPIS